MLLTKMGCMYNQGVTMSELLANSATIAAWDWTDPASMTAGDTGPVVQGDGDTIDTVPNADESGNYSLRNTVEADRPVYNNGGVFNGSTDYLFCPFPSGAGTGPSNATVVLAVKTTDTHACLLGSDSGSHSACILQDASALDTFVGFGGAPAYEVDGVTVTGDRDALHTAIADGTTKIVVISNIDASAVAIAQFRFGRLFGGAFLDGTQIIVALLDGDDANYADGLTIAKTLAAQHVATLGM